MINENKNKNDNLISMNTDISKTEELNFDSYFEIFPERRTEEHYKFLCWFVGFCEGNCCISVIPSKKQPHLYKTNLQIGSIDFKILKYIRKELGFGTVSYKADTKITDIKSYAYVINDKKNINNIIRIFNGNVVFNKTYKKVQNWIEISAKFLDTNSKLMALPQQAKITLNNAWLAGFIDGDAGFNIHLTKDQSSKSKFAIKACLDLYQEDEFLALNNIQLLFNSKTKVRKRTNTINGYILRLQSISSINLLVKYLEEFQLKRENRKLSFENWKRLLPYMEQKNLYPIVKNKKKFEELKKQIKNLNSHSIKSPEYKKRFK